MTKLLTLGVYLITFCLPLYLLRFKLFTIPTTVLEISIYILFITWLISRLFQKKQKSIQCRKILLPILLIFIGVSLSTVLSSDLKVSAGIWKAWFVDPLLFFIVFIAVIKNANKAKYVIYSLFLSGSTMAIISLIYLISGKLDAVNRLQAVYNSPNYLGMYLAPALIIGVWIIIQNRIYNKNKTNLFFKIIPWILSAIILISLWHTQSYGAGISIILAVSIGLLVKIFKSHRKAAWGILIAAVIFVSVLGLFSVNAKSSSLGARLIIWEKVLSIYTQNPILGIGPGTLGNYFPPYPQWGVPQPHNVFLAFLLQTGIVGFIGFIWLLIWFFKTGLRNLELNNLNLGLIFLMSYTLIHGLVDTTYWKNDLAVMFWVITGLMLILNKNN